MKILMMHRGDGDMGGGQVQMNRLLVGLRMRGIDARILCRDASRADSVRMPAIPWLEKPLHRLTRRLGLNEMHLASSFAVRRMADVQDADLIDFHCLHCETLSYLALPGLTDAKPAVFTFHDMWPLTGHCQAAASAVEILATIYAFQTGFVPAPPQVSAGHPRLLNGLTARLPGPMIKSSIGMGGFNSALVIGEPPA